jgi:hypothetical protein
MKPALPGFFRDPQHVFRIARPFEAVDQHHEGRARVFSLLPVAAAQESGVGINLKMSILGARQGEPPQPEVGRNRHSVAVLEQSVWHERLSCIERHLSNLSEPPAQNKLTPGNHAAVSLTVVAWKASIHVQGKQALNSNGGQTDMEISVEARFEPLEWPSVNAAASKDTGDEPLVKAAQRGDRLAFGQLYQRYVRMVHGILLARVPSAAAEDLVHDVFLQALPKLAALRDVSRFGPWLAAIARNRATDFHRRTKADCSLDDQAGAAEAPESPEREIAIEDSIAAPMQSASCRTSIASH